MRYFSSLFVATAVAITGATLTLAPAQAVTTRGLPAASADFSVDAGIEQVHSRKARHKHKRRHHARRGRHHHHHHYAKRRHLPPHPGPIVCLAYDWCPPHHPGPAVPYHPAPPPVIFYP